MFSYALSVLTLLVSITCQAHSTPVLLTSVFAVPVLPPQCNTATVEGQPTIICTGYARSAPFCESVNIAMIKAFMSWANYTGLSFTCSGNFGGGDAAWCAVLGSELATLAPLQTLALDVSGNNLCGDNVAHVLAKALSSSPALEALSFSAILGNVSDAGATAIGAALLQAPTSRSITRLTIDLSYNDKGDHDDMPLTAVGAGALGRAIGAMAQLQSLALNMSYNLQLGGEGILALSAGLLPLRSANHLAYVELQLG